ncbi:replication-relaxation family protein [Anaerobacillus sp. CMMVII]|uniref:replication-relaxation family protein n=1 Tax=Anaerobacillus sp. CMMVII TaxID=2755588 RepID=UPI0021B829AB|nr:replication-relaxation family protein [Anaerobacillus sp. CMMVII]MCT8138662.1 replication-relaxation family protein [Anaerobacillus sp. CMMVII]
MNTWNGTLIRKKMHEILLVLYLLRGITNEQLRRYFNPHLQSNVRGQLANISRNVSVLKELKLISSVSCHPHSKEELNFLTRKGIEYIHKNCIIEHEGNDDVVGFLEGPLRSFEYEILKPPTRYIEHHHMLIDTIVDYSHFGRFRNNLYCVKQYDLLDRSYGYKKKAKVKPDAELKTIKGLILAVEIDTGTERTEKLIQKFSNYRRYLDYCLQNDIKIPWVGILFQTQRGNEILNIKDDQRWQTILKAAVDGLSYYCWNIHVLGFKDLHL